MALHVFGAIVTAHGTAANNRGVTEGNVMTLQKLVWQGQVHTTVSAEAIRFALRQQLPQDKCNRTFDDAVGANIWCDPEFRAWAGKGAKAKEAEEYFDDDLLGFMSAKGAAEEGGPTKARRGVLEVTRAVSLNPWAGDVTFNAASPGATPSAEKKGTNPVPYGTEMHATRYQYGFALTPDRLRVKERAAIAVKALCSLSEVAGNQGRFLYDFSPESVVFRITDDPAPRILHIFREVDGAVSTPDLPKKIRAGDIKASELVIGGAIVESLEKTAFEGAALFSGILAACEEACKRFSEKGK